MREHWLNKFNSRSRESRLEKQGAALCMDNASIGCAALGVCFSEESDLLSQWRGYADDGSGFSITFSRRDLEEVSRDHASGKLELTKIAYGNQDWDKINAIVRVLHDAFGADARLYNESNGIGSLSLDFGPNGEKHTVYEDAARSLFKVKNGAFREEKEWRLFTYGRLSSINGVKLRGTGEAISPYIPVKVPADSVLQVTLGPTNQTPRHVLEFALKHYGLSGANIRNSGASYQKR